ncbi:MAG: TIGR04282 family arsenosugar biosynthesis glycosyltransferase [Candidatus Omnitrophica bacterium]|nr:TIGR04282 family arsenosugar biosynthesis glycosyltransferase [Candidatus Omnitrophota bacterium]
MSGTLVVFAKTPRAGYVKTRLVPPLTSREAAALAEALLRDTASAARRVPVRRRLIAYAPQPPAPRHRPRGFAVMAQRGHSLGARMLVAFRQFLRPGVPVVIIGTDSPTLPGRHLQQAFLALRDHDLVVGPTDDGGYYLLGISRPVSAALFRGVVWSSSSVCRRTLANARRLGYSVRRLPIWHDIDTLPDLRRLERALRQRKTRAPHTWRVLQEWLRTGVL